MVEFAIAFPLQLFITMGLMQLIMLYVSSLMVNYAAFRAARAAITASDTTSATEAAERTAQILLTPLSTNNGDGFEVTSEDRVYVPGWGWLKNSEYAAAKCNVYLTSTRPVNNMMTVVVEWHQELIFPGVDYLFMTVCDQPDAQERAFGELESSGSNQRLYGQAGGPFVRVFGDSVYLVIIRTCTLYHDPILPFSEEDPDGAP